MKKTYFTFLFILVNVFIIQAQTQLELSKQASDEYQKVDKELNNVYQKILKEYSSDTLFIKNLRASQIIWIRFRDAELKVKYPETESGYYGSVFPMCKSIYLSRLTQQRIVTLKIWLDGIEEGDACAGSVKSK